MDSWRTVAALAALGDLPDLGDEGIPPCLSLGAQWCPAPPVVEPAATNSQDGAHEADGVLGSMGGDEHELGRHIFVAHCAKKAKAFLMISFSSFRRLFSLRSCASPALSAFRAAIASTEPSANCSRCQVQGSRMNLSHLRFAARKGMVRPVIGA